MSDASFLSFAKLRHQILASRRPIRRFSISQLWKTCLMSLALATAFVASAETPYPVPEDVAAPPADAEVTASGLASKVLTAGVGTQHPDDNDHVAVHFVGWTKFGAEFQNSHGQEKPAVFNLEVVFPGWREAMKLMVHGEKRRFWIPEHLGPPNPKSGPTGDATFDVEMVAIRQMPNPPDEITKPPSDADRTPSGAFTRRLETGWGEEFPSSEGAVLLQYTGWTTDGKTFDSTITRNRPTAFALDKVMSPFAEAIQLMVVGEKRQVWIPGKLAEGNWMGSPKGMLIFEVELIDILPDGALQREPIPGKPESGAAAGTLGGSSGA